MNNGNGSGSSFATLGDLLASKAQSGQITDLNTTREQLERVKRELADEKNAKEAFRDELIKINRMVNGQGWDNPGDVTANVQRFTARSSKGAAVELEAQLKQSESVEQELRRMLASADEQLRQAQRSAAKLRADLKCAEQDKTMLFNEAQRLKREWANAEKETNRWRQSCGEYEVAIKELRKKLESVPQAAPLAEEEREALMALLTMEREDRERLARDILQAAADAAESVRKSELPMMPGSRSLNYFNRGLTLGAGAVESAVARAIHNIRPQEEGSG